MSDTIDEMIATLRHLHESKTVGEWEFLSQFRQWIPEILLAAEQSAAMRDRVLELESLLRLAKKMAGHNHWDKTMMHGAGCPLCIEQKAICQAIDAALTAAAPQTGEE